MSLLTYALAMVGAFYVGMLWRDYVIPFLVDRHLRSLAVALPGIASGVLVLLMR